MTLIRKYFWQLLVLILVIMLFLQNSCNNNIKDNPNVIITKPSEGSFGFEVPDEIDLPNYIYIPIKGDEVIFENPLNQKLKNQYDLAVKENDSLKLKLLYYTAIQKRSYKKVFDNKDITATIYAMTTGTLDSIRMDYIEKPDTIVVKQPVFRLLTGTSLMFNPTTLKYDLSLNAGIQNKKGNIFTGSVNTHKDISIGYLHNLWTIKK